MNGILFVKARTMVTILVICSLVPFIMVTDMYPFFRFGMFAEPVRNSSQVEEFVVMEQSGNKWSILNQEALGLHKSQLDYLYRNYYYSNRSYELLSNIAGLVPKTSEIGKLRLCRIARPLATSNSDTTVVYELNLKQ